MDEIKQLLEALIPEIDVIDGGCPVCIESFVNGTNEVLEELSIPYRYLFTDDYKAEYRVLLMEPTE